MAAAIDEFARRGFEGASTLEIARAAGTRQPLLNYHYGSKEQLWHAAVDAAFVELGLTFESIEETSADARPVDILRLMLRVLNRFATRHPRHIDIMRQEMGARSSRTDYLLEQHLAPMYRHINRVVQAAVEAREIKPVPPQFLSSLLFGAISHYFGSVAMLTDVYSLDVGDPAQAKRHGDWLVEILFEGLRQPEDESSPRSDLS